MGCCKCLGTLLCLAVLAGGGVVVWRYGPWFGESTDTAQPSSVAIDTCAGCCNGLASNCDLPLDAVTFAMVHNAHSSKDDLFLGYNNNRRLEDALVAGYRGLMLDSCLCEGSVSETLQNLWSGEQKADESKLGFCHASCEYGVRSPSKVMGNIKEFLDVNRNEVLIIEFEINDYSLAQLYAAIDDSGIDKYVYSDRSAAEWPTLQALIDAGTRLVLFAHGDGMESCAKVACPEGVFYTFDHFQQTDWNDVSCDVKGGGARRGSGFFLMNHWMNNESTELPSATNSAHFNTYGALATRIDKCEGGAPNIVAVDFWDVGDVLAVVEEINTKKG